MNPPASPPPLRPPHEAPPPGRPAPAHGRRRQRQAGWVLPAVLVLVAGFAAAGLAAVWLATHPEHLRRVAEGVANAVSEQPVAIGSLDLRRTPGGAVVELRDLRTGQTSTERVSVSFEGPRAVVEGSGVRLPRGSSVGRFRAPLRLSPWGLPRLSAIEADEVVLVTRRRDAAGPPGTLALDAALAVPRRLLGLGAERLAVRSGEVRHRGRDGIVTTLGVTVQAEASESGVSLRGGLAAGPGLPPLALEGTVGGLEADGDPVIEARLAGDGLPMRGVRTLVQILEPPSEPRELLEAVSGRARFRLAMRIARSRIEAVDIDFALGAPEAPGGAGLPLDGLHFAARAAPGPSGWSAEGEAYWPAAAANGGDSGEDDGGGGAAPSPFAVRWTTGVAGSTRVSARGVPIPALAGLVRNAPPSGHPLRALLDRTAPRGRIEEVAASGAADDFRLEAVLSGFGAAAGGARLEDARLRVEHDGGEWRIRPVDERLRVAVPAWWSAPLALEVGGEVRAGADDDGGGGGAWTVRTEGLDVRAGGVAARVEGSLRAPLPDAAGADGGGGAPFLDARVRLDGLDLRALAEVLPDRRGAEFARWYRQAVRAGRLAEGVIEVRGDPARIPFPGGGGELTARGTVRGVELAPAPGWPAARGGRAEVRAAGPLLEFLDAGGSVFGTRVEGAAVRIPDVTDLQGGRIRASLAGRGPAGDLLAFLRESPLGERLRGLPDDLRADGPAVTRVELDLPYARGWREPAPAVGVEGTVELAGARVGIPGRDTMFEDVRGVLRFDAERLSGGPLAARLLGAEVEAHADFERGEGLRVRLAGEDGDGEWFGVALDALAGLEPRATAPWLARVEGRLPWRAEYASRSGLTVETGLEYASLDFPPPFDKAAGAPRVLRTFIAPRAEGGWRLELDYGREARGVFEIDPARADSPIARGAVVLGGGAAPRLPAASHVEVSGRLPGRLQVEPWLALLSDRDGADADWLERVRRIDLETAAVELAGYGGALRRLRAVREDGGAFRIGLEGEDVAGELLIPPGREAADPVRLRLARLHLSKLPAEPPDPARAAAPPELEEPEPEPPAEPHRWWPFTARVASLRLGGAGLERVEAVGERAGGGLAFTRLAARAPGLEVRGSGSWLPAGAGTSVTRIEARAESDDVAKLLAAAGVEDGALAGGAVDARLDVAWPGSPLQARLAKLEGRFELEAEDGRLPRVDTGLIGRLLALLSLNALPRVLSLDLSHVFSQGFAYDRIAIASRLEGGEAHLDEFTISAPSAKIEVDGRFDLETLEYDQTVSVIPRLTRSGALIPIWSVAWPVLAANFLIERLSDDEASIDRVFRIRYALQGPWDDPRIERERVEFPESGP